MVSQQNLDSQNLDGQGWGWGWGGNNGQILTVQILTGNPNVCGMFRRLTPTLTVSDRA